MMIEELARVVRSFEQQLGTIKSNIAFTENRIEQTLLSKDFESSVNQSLQNMQKKVEDNHKLLMAELAHLKRRHARLLSLYSAGLEGTLGDSLKDTATLSVKEDINEVNFKSQ